MPSLLEGKAAVGHLLRRAGFGPSASTWSSWAQLDYDSAVDRALSELDEPLPPDPEGWISEDPTVDGKVWVPGAIQQLWRQRMVQAPCGLAEKLAFFWHGHFATDARKHANFRIAWDQYKLFRTKGAGSFRDLVLGVSRDVAMVRFLDGNANRAGHGNANENYARELQELFTLGIGNYTEKDIREIGRAFTGWGSRGPRFVFKKHFHDEGQKTVHGKTGNFGGEDVVDILVDLPACSRFIAGKLLRFFSHPEPSEAEIEDLAKVFRANKLDIKSTLASMFRSETFRARAHHRALVTSPIEFVVGATRAVGLPDVPSNVASTSVRMGQILFNPPSVKGWTSGKGWLGSAAIVERLRAAQLIRSAVADGLGLSPKSERYKPALAEAADRLLEVALQGQVPGDLAAALQSAKEHDRIAIILGSPEFQLA